jgi:aryl-alcohol dehydrogenase-like predicted oxidoreductase
MQNHYNLIYREEEREMIPLCVKEGIGVIPWSPLARGLLAGSRKSLDDRSSTTRAETDKANELYDDPSDWAVVEAVRKVASARNVSPAEVALAWLLAKPGVVAPIVGSTKIEHLDTAVRSVELSLSEEEMKSLEAPYRPHPVRGWL